MINPISVILADDHEMVRESLARVLDSCDEINVVGQVGCGRELVAAVRESQPACLVMDYSMPNHEPVEVIKQLLREFQHLRIMMLTVHENVHYAVRTLEAGAHGYLIKSAAFDELVDAIKTIKRGDVISLARSHQMFGRYFVSPEVNELASTLFLKGSLMYC